jgi:succinate dehydrogenase/fumarate reductase flavoprotein subunit
MVDEADKRDDNVLIEWPYPIRFGEESEISTDVLVVGGGPAGCFSAIGAAKKGAKVVLVEKGTTITGGAAGTGVDHWQFAADTPCCKLSAEEIAGALVENNGGYTSGISRYIQAREGYDTLCELESMGAKVRDTEDEFKNCPFRDEATKLLFAYDYENKYTIRVWGSTFKKVLYKECRRLGVEIYNRVMGTSLLTEGGKQGARVIGATGLNVRTGKFYIFKAKATILCNSRPQRNWVFVSEHRGITSFRGLNNAGNGHAMAWRAGADLAMMEKSIPVGSEGAGAFPPYGTGNPRNTWYPCTMVDAYGKEIPWVDCNGKILKTIEERTRPAEGQKFFLEGGGISSKPHPGLDKYRGPRPTPDLPDRVRKGEFKLPLYADLPSMPDCERRIIFGMMVGEEAKTRIPILRTYNEAGFDPNKDLLQGYQMLAGEKNWKSLGSTQERAFGEFGVSGGLLVDWDLKTSLDGLYAAGDTLFGTEGYSHAACTGRYAGRKAAEYVQNEADPVIDRLQVEREKTRVYQPTKVVSGMEWKELNAGIARVMQTYCGGIKSEELLRIGLMTLNEIKDNESAAVYASDPHKLGRTLDVLDILTSSEIIIHACMARKASSELLHFQRSDYHKTDPPEWHKWLTVREDNGEVKTDLLPIDFWGDLKRNYEEHCVKG